jgi:hypothetical protein
MSRKCPRTLPELAKISGVGKKKLDSFGDEFVAAIDEYADPQGVNGEDPAATGDLSLEFTAGDQLQAGTHKNGGRSYQMKIEDMASAEAFETTDKLFEEALDLQERVDRLTLDLEKAKKSLEETMDKIKAGDVMENDRYRLVKIDSKIKKIDVRPKNGRIPDEALPNC